MRAPVSFHVATTNWSAPFLSKTAKNQINGKKFTEEGERDHLSNPRRDRKKNHFSEGHKINPHYCNAQFSRNILVNEQTKDTN